MPQPFRLIDLFAGAGGLTLGVLDLRDEDGQPVFSSVWANDYNEDAAATYRANFGDHCSHGDIVDILEAPTTVVPKADVVRRVPSVRGSACSTRTGMATPGSRYGSSDPAVQASAMPRRSLCLDLTERQ